MSADAVAGGRTASPVERVLAAGRELEAAAGDDRPEAVYRAFATEVAAVLSPATLAFSADERAECWEAVAEFADEHLTEEIRLRLPAEQRVRVSLAERRETALLEAALADEEPGFLLEDGRLYARYPGFRERAHGLPPEWYEVGAGECGTDERVADRLERGVQPRYVVWTGVKRADYRIEYSFYAPVEGLGAESVRVGAVRIEAGGAPAPRAAVAAGGPDGPEIEAEVEVKADGEATAVTARLLTAELIGRGPGRWTLRAYLTLRDCTYDLPLKAPAGYIQRAGMPPGVSVDWDAERALAVKVGERATLRGPARLLPPSIKLSFRK
ncbi:hypothetical protein [Glycomyces albidus]|uniref:TarS/TarP linker domain-containing protein n=1 Tax=Glycomyces albidus TaxID=2656774 RepID=A0A6L5GFF2_9ACTN|nr:hypothetical protein [Glycomyces albidus]MQM28429.1 hypothetical protein [Glycomyces albidus]